MPRVTNTTARPGLEGGRTSLPAKKQSNNSQPGISGSRPSPDTSSRVYNSHNAIDEKKSHPTKDGKSVKSIANESRVNGSLKAPDSKSILAHLENLQSQVSRFNRPLVLVTSGDSDKTPKEFFRADVFLLSLPVNADNETTLRNLDFFIFDFDSSPNLRQIDVKNMANQNKDLYLAVLSSLNPTVSQGEHFANQVALAAILASGGFGFEDTRLAKKIIAGVPSSFRQFALDSALFVLSDETGLASVKLILNWGASPNALNPDDDMSILYTAVLFENLDLIRLLMFHGANAKDDLGSQVSAQMLTRRERYSYIEPLLTQK